MSSGPARRPENRDWSRSSSSSSVKMRRVSLGMSSMHSGETSTAHPGGSASFVHLLSPKWRSMRARAVKTNTGAIGRGAVLGVVGIAFWGLIFAVIYRLLAYFRGIPEIGPLLAGKLLGLILVSFFGMLLLSNVISALSTFFLAKDLDQLVAGPVDWLRLYIARL